MDSMDFEKIYRGSNGFLKLPFSNLSLFFRVERIKIHNAESRALMNMYQFFISLGILLERLHSYLNTFKENSWLGVPIHELFLDTQSIFLFIQQYLEDLGFVIRLSFTPSEREQLSPKFNRIARRLSEILVPDHKLKVFLDNEIEWFERLKDIRDDICHRTAFGRARDSLFPDIQGLLSSAGGIDAFLSEGDLRDYIHNLLRRLLALSCLCDSFVTHRFKERYPQNAFLVASGYLIEEGAIDLNTCSETPLFPEGTMIMTMGSGRYRSIEFFLSPRERYNPPLQPTASGRG